MKNSMVNVQARRNNIISMLKSQDSISINELTRTFGISEMTARRDVRTLSNMGLLKLDHGMIQVIEPSTNYEDADQTNISRIKSNIAAAVTNIIEENSTLFVNSSSLCWRAINKLSTIPLTIITNNIHATECAKHPETSIILTGGEVRYPKESLVGSVAVKFLETMESDFTLIGCDGISLDKGITSDNIYESQINSTMIQCTKKKVICLADYRKIGMSSNYHVADFSDIDILITDNFSDEEVIKGIERKGIKVIQVVV